MFIFVRYNHITYIQYAVIDTMLSGTPTSYLPASFIFHAHNQMMMDLVA